MDVSKIRERSVYRPVRQTQSVGRANKHRLLVVARVLLAIPLGCLSVSDATARSSYGPSVDSACLAFNGTQPYADFEAQNPNDPCAFCHVPSPGSKATRVDPEWTWWQNQFTQITNFCPEQTNQAPDGAIAAPANNATFNVGSAVAFSGTGSDPDNNTPFTYQWNFGGAATNSTLQNPTVTLNNTGTFSVTFTVTDSLGRADPSPATIVISVTDPNANRPPNGTIDTPANNVSVNVGDAVAFSGSGSDPDNNTPLTYLWTFGGAAADSSLQSPEVTFSNPGIYTVSFTVTDSLGLSDPTPDTRTVSVGTGGTACSDQDNDMFSPDGGVCGPIDCNDFDASVNPGSVEACGDGVDNDCNGDIDGSDAHCNGGECLADLLREVAINSAYWDSSERELKVKGIWTTPGATVEIFDAITGEFVGSTTVRTYSGDDSHEDDEHGGEASGGGFYWEFEKEHLDVVPCRVRVEIEGRFGERDVAYAPSNCSGKPPAFNNPPQANDDQASTRPREAVKIDVLANDTDSDGDRLTIIVFTQPEHGVVTKDENRLVYTPSRRFVGSDRFGYTVSDGHGGTDTAQVTVTVQGRTRERDDR